MYQALRSLGVDSKLVIYPGQFHGITTPSYKKDRLERYLEWYAQVPPGPAVHDVRRLGSGRVIALPHPSVPSLLAPSTSSQIATSSVGSP